MSGFFAFYFITFLFHLFLFYNALHCIAFHSILLLKATQGHGLTIKPNGDDNTLSAPKLNLFIQSLWNHGIRQFPTYLGEPLPGWGRQGRTCVLQTSTPQRENTRARCRQGVSLPSSKLISHLAQVFLPLEEIKREEGEEGFVIQESLHRVGENIDHVK